jgi:hypothetical protein
VSGLTARHFELYRLMLATSWTKEGGRPVCTWGQAKLAGRLGVTPRTVQRLVADLREPGFDPRHPDVKPSGLRLGWLLVLPRERRGGRGGKLYGADQYVLQLDPEQLANIAAQTGLPSSDRSDTPKAEREPAEPDTRRSDRSDTNYRSDTAEEPVSAGQTEATREPMSLSHYVPQGGSDTHLEGGDRARAEPHADALGGSRSADNGSQDPEQGPVPVDWHAALGKPLPPDDGERFASREAEEQAKRRRAEQLLVVGRSPPAAATDAPTRIDANVSLRVAWERANHQEKMDILDAEIRQLEEEELDRRGPPTPPAAETIAPPTGEPDPAALAAAVEAALDAAGVSPEMREAAYQAVERRLREREP